MQLGCSKNTLIGYEVYEEVGILHCWWTIEAARFPVSEMFYRALRVHNQQFLNTANLTMTLEDKTT